MIECSRPIRFFRVSLMYNNRNNVDANYRNNIDDNYSDNDDFSDFDDDDDIGDVIDNYNDNTKKFSKHDEPMESTKTRNGYLLSVSL